MKKLLIVILVLVVILTGGLFAYLSGLGAADPGNQDEIIVQIPEGSSGLTILGILDENGLVKNPTCAKINVKTGGYDSLQANTYKFSKDMKFTEIMKAINTGDFKYVYHVNFQVAENAWLTEIAASLSDAIGVPEKDILAKWADKDYLNALIEKYWFLTDDILDEKIEYPLEGYFYPDTYAVTGEETSVEEATELMLDNMDKHIKDYRQDMEASSYSIHELMTLASIVTFEGGGTDADETQVSTIAGVFMNRLKEGIPLGSDVTINYIIKERRVSLKQSELDSQSPYNTRRYNGLPPGPIGTSCESDIKAVVYPADTDYYFFYATESGEVKFFKTNEEFEKGWAEDQWSDADDEEDSSDDNK